MISIFSGGAAPQKERQREIETGTGERTRSVGCTQNLYNLRFEFDARSNRTNAH